MDLWEADDAKYQEELGVWQGRDRMILSILHGLDDALVGDPSFPLLHLYSPTLLFFSPAVLIEALPDSSNATAITVDKCQEEYNIIRDKDSTAELSLVELAASVKGRLQPVASFELQLRTAIAFVFKTLWLGWEEPSIVSQLVQWMALVSNRVEVWKESVARAGAEQALSFVLSWYQDIDLDQLEHLRKDG
jgi:hypothetical protein